MGVVEPVLPLASGTYWASQIRWRNSIPRSDDPRSYRFH